MISWFIYFQHYFDNQSWDFIDDMAMFFGEMLNVSYKMLEIDKWNREAG